MPERGTEIPIGFEAFTSYIERAQPRAFIHRHQHVNRDPLVGRTHAMGNYAQRRIHF